MTDARARKSRSAIAEALVRLLESKPFSQITVSELAAEAGVSRSTFYAHYENTHQVFADAVRDFLTMVRPITAQLRCGACADEPQGTPFCVALRKERRYRPLVHDDQFLPTFLKIAREESSEDMLRPYLNTGASIAEAHALYRFQMTGCYTVAMAAPDDVDGEDGWPAIQGTLDTFIRGGMAALRNR